MTGLQWGVLMAHSKSVSGIQGSFVFSGAGAFSGLQFGTVASYARRGAGLQAGAVCIADPDREESGPICFSGIQLGVLCNVGSGEGIQVSLALLSNCALRCRGVQIGALNRADELQGVQFGLINVADSGAGLQIGLINSFGSDGDRLILPFLNARF